MYANKKQHTSFRDACYALGLLEDDKEYVDAIIEASEWATGYELRSLFATLLSSDCLSRPEDIWDKCWVHLSEDYRHKNRHSLNNGDFHINEDIQKNLALIDIDKILQRRGKRIWDYRTLPEIDFEGCAEILSGNKYISEEMHYNKVEMLREYTHLRAALNKDQSNIFDTVIDAVYGDKGGLFFVYGYGGTGKTFIWRTLSAFIRSKGDIVLNVASSGIASLLLPGGRTAHSRFKIPININEDSTCSITVGSPLAQLILKCSLIIWDEAPMMHKHCFEALDRTIQDTMKSMTADDAYVPFGGKTVVLGGDFRQILPVVQKGTRQAIVNASLSSSYLWRYCTVLKLTKNMRLEQCSSSEESDDLKVFSEWISSIGDGTCGPENDGIVDIEIPEDILLNGGDKPLSTIVSATYPNFDATSNDYSYLNGRAILAPRLDMVEEINDHMISMNTTDEGTEFLSSDSTCQRDFGVDTLQNMTTPETLNSIKASGLPNHKLLLKVGTPVMLLKNIDHSLGLCNGTRMVITRVAAHVLEARLIAGTNAGDTVLIPRMTLTPSDSKLPFKLRRRQFPLIVSYAMTINKSQGQSLTNVGLFLRNPVFSHGQLYVAVSRVTNRKGLKILSCDKDGKSCSVTKNVVYKEVLRNL